MRKLVVIELTCTFELHNYPFDNQECYLNIGNIENVEEIVKLIPAPKVGYSGGFSFLNYEIDVPELIDTTESCKDNGNCDKFKGTLYLQTTKSIF